jgi:creatinine amidohydrolase
MVAPTPKRFWADLSTLEFERLDPGRTIAVLPVAATEQHGPHLPVSVDTRLIDGLIAAIVPRLPPAASVLFLPTLAIGKSNEHERFAGTLSLSAQTLLDVWMELGASVARAGIRKLVLFNSHGGQSAAMDIVAPDLRALHDLLVFSVNWYRLGLPPGLIGADELRFGIHGGEVETSMMLALAPHLVDMSKAQAFDSALRRHALDYPLLGSGVAAKLGWQTQDLNPAGAIGNAAAASAHKGEAIIGFVAGRFVQLLQELEQMPLSSLVARSPLPGHDPAA